MNTIDLNKFNLKESLGRGSFGEVRKVEEKETGNIYAAKISLRFLDNESKEDILELTREVNIMSMINHPSVVRFIGFNLHDFHNDPKPVIITEYLKNGTLKEVINLERLSMSIWDDTKKLINIYGIAAAMAYLHSNHIIHRDLKPENILMDEYLCPRISDFGLSKIKHQNSDSITMQSSANIKGTPIYISPEIYQKMDYSMESDVYAYAYIIYEIITNEIPFSECKLIYEIPARVIQGIRPKFPYPIADAYQSLIERCWSQDPSKRPTFDEIVDELKNDPNYITDEIEKDDFDQYVDYIEEYKKTFNKTKQMLKIEDFIKSKTNSFKQVTVDRKKVSQLMKSMIKESLLDQPSGIKIKETIHRSFSKSKTIQINDISQQAQSQPTFKKIDESQTVNTKDKTKSRKSFFFKKSKSKSYIDDLPDNECNQLIKSSDGTPEKQFQVGKYFIEGTNNFPKNTKNGIDFLKKAVKGECIDGVIYYSSMLIKGNIIPRNLSKAKKILKKHLKKENATVLYLYGKIQKKEKCYNKAAQYFSKASENGNAEAMYSYAKLLFHGLGCLRNDSAAKYYFDLAKNNGYDKSEFFLSKQTGDRLYTFGMNVYSSKELEANKEEAAKCFQLAITKNNVPAMVQYALMLLNGEGVSVDKQKAFNYFKTAAEKGNDDGMFYAGDMLYQGVGVSIDKNEAGKYLKYAITKGNSLARRKYSKIFENVDANQKNPAQNVKSMKDAADRGDVNQSYNVGMMLIKGIGCQANLKEGIRYIKAAAERNHVDAMYEYAKILDEGQKVPRDADAALHYYKLAADKGHVDAKKNYANILKRRKDDNIPRYDRIIMKDFNSFPLSTKHSVISQIAHDNQNDYFSLKLHNLSSFLMQFNELKEKKCFEITFNDNSTLLSFVNSSEQIKIQIPWMTSDVLFYNSVSYDILNDLFSFFGSVFMELKYPSNSFSELYQYVFGMVYTVKHIRMTIYITGIQKTDSAFMNNKFIRSVKLDSSVSEIYGNMFENVFAFDGCENLENVTIPSSVTTIGDGAFRGCSSLEQITIPSSVTYLGYAVFFDCTFLKEIIIPPSVTETGDNVCAGCSSLTHATIPSSLSKISDGFFKNCSSLKQISIPSSITEIGWNAFKQCSSLEQISIPPSVTVIGENAFNGCTSLTQITIPPYVTEIGENAFIGCTSLKHFTIPSNINMNDIGLTLNTEVHFIKNDVH